MPDTSLIYAKRISRIDEKMRRVDSLRPLPADAVKRLHEEMRLLHTYHSDAIEGNTLTLSETKLLLATGMTIGGKALAEHIEAANNARAFDLINDLAEGGRAIDHVTIQEIHEVVAAGTLEDCGRYRTHNVRITGAKKTPPDWSKVVGLMDRLIEEIAESGTHPHRPHYPHPPHQPHPVEIAASLHHRFVEIHPFTDGNGRVARLLSNLYLIARGYPPVVIMAEDRGEYYRCLRAADAGNPAPFNSFIAKAVDVSLTSYLAITGGDDELVPLKELASMADAPYSQEYLSLRARQGALDAVKIGGVWHSSRRAVAQYAKSHRGSGTVL